MRKITIVECLSSNINLPLHTTYHVLYSFVATICVPPQLICVMELALVKETLYSVRCRYVQNVVVVIERIYEIRVV